MRHIHPYQVIGVIVLIAVLWYVRKRKAEAAGGSPGAGKGGPGGRAAVVQKVAKVEEPPETIYMNLRRKALETNPQTLGLPGDFKEDEPYGLLMELGMPNSVVTLACFADGDARVYYKTGGGMVGGVSHESIRKASKDLIALTQKALPRMTKTNTHPLPAQDRVRFYALTSRGTFTTETDRRALAKPGTSFRPCFPAARRSSPKCARCRRSGRTEGGRRGSRSSSARFWMDTSSTSWCGKTGRRGPTLKVLRPEPGEKQGGRSPDTDRAPARSVRSACVARQARPTRG